MKPKLMRASRWTLQRLRSMCELPVVGVLEPLDTTKYLLNLDVNSAYYDPKTRSMREDPLPDVDPNEKFYIGDNHNRLNGQALEFQQLNIHAWESFDKVHDIHLQAAPSQAELLYRNFKINKEKLKYQTKESIMDKYGNAAAEETLPKDLLLGQSEREIEYDPAGRIIKGQYKSFRWRVSSKRCNFCRIFSRTREDTAYCSDA